MQARQSCRCRDPCWMCAISHCSISCPPVRRCRKKFCSKTLMASSSKSAIIFADFIYTRLNVACTKHVSANNMSWHVADRWCWALPPLFDRPTHIRTSRSRRLDDIFVHGLTRPSWIPLSTLNRIKGLIRAQSKFQRYIDTMC